jgi:hypothetical protein
MPAQAAPVAQVLITRFNLTTPGREAAYRGAAGWLAGRFDLFERYCLPSVRDQTQRDVTWLVLFDDQTPGWARERIARAQAVVPFRAVFTPLFDNQGWGRFVRDAIGPAQPGRRVITSNLDNDDALATDYLARLRDAAILARRKDTFALNVTNGLILARHRLYRFDHPANAFTTLVEPDQDPLRTTMTIRHNELAQHVPVVQVPGAPGWLQVVHGGNVSNRVRGAVVARPDTTGFAGDILADVAPPATIELLHDRVLADPLRRLRDTAITVYRRFRPVDKPGRANRS